MASRRDGAVIDEQGGTMILSSYIHEQSADAHRRDLLEAAGRARLTAHAPARSGMWQRFNPALRWPGTHPRAAAPRRLSGPTPTAAAR